MRVTISLVCVAAALALASGSPAQTKASSYKPARLADGHPDLNGIWEVRGKVDANLEARVNGKGVIVDPPDGRIPYKPEELAKKKQNEKNKATEDPVVKCQMPGVPRLAYVPYPFQIVESANQPVIAFLSQYVHTIRNINMGGEHLDGLDLWMGDSRGHWDGDTLVIDVADFNDMTWFDEAGSQHSDALHVVERFTRTGPTTISYEATIEDPKVLTKPFRIAMPLMLHTEKNAQVLEYECYADKEGPTVTVGDKPDPHGIGPK
ncbi:MAG TPA: hypothetical protein VHZ74_26220 [Bryobacteraceae bacterium]|nr:hypothetical protein [Bryobacteraceae bacterium]